MMRERRENDLFWCKHGFRLIGGDDSLAWNAAAPQTVAVPE